MKGLLIGLLLSIMLLGTSNAASKLARGSKLAPNLSWMKYSVGVWNCSWHEANGAVFEHSTFRLKFNDRWLVEESRARLPNGRRVASVFYYGRGRNSNTMTGYNFSPQGMTLYHDFTDGSTLREVSQDGRVLLFRRVGPNRFTGSGTPPMKAFHGECIRQR